MFGRTWRVYDKSHLYCKGDGKQTIDIWSNGVLESYYAKASYDKYWGVLCQLYSILLHRYRKR